MTELRAPWLTERLAELAVRHDVPGASVAVLQCGELVTAVTGVTNARTGVEVTADTLFQIGSITKPYVAALVLELAAEGLADLDEPATRYVLELASPSRDVAEPVTLRHLLTHTSGIGGDHFADHGRGDDCLERYVRSLAAVPSDFAPGERFSYCNSGFVVLGRLVERLRGATFEEVVRDRLVERLRLRETVTLPEEALLHRCAVGHGTSGVVGTWGFGRAMGPAGGLVASARDVARFGLALFRGDVVELPGPVGEPAVADVPWVGVEHWGLGWVQYVGGEDPVVGHDGSAVGQTASLRVAPAADLAVALVTNSTTGSALAADLLPLLLERLGAPPTPTLPVPLGALAGAADAFTGTFRRYGVTIEVTCPSGGALELTTRWNDDGIAPPGATPQTVDLLPLDDRSFAARSRAGTADALVRFEDRDGGGRFRVVTSGGRAAFRVP